MQEFTEDTAHLSPLAHRIFQRCQARVTKVALGLDFVTVEKVEKCGDETICWNELCRDVAAALSDHLASGEEHLTLDAEVPHADTQPADGDSDIVLMIKELMVESIRPALQADGGDVKYVAF